MTYAGFRSRSDLNLRNPKSRSYDVHPEDGGVAVHWGGDGNAPSNHADCESRWRGWQNYHMDSKGWADIAYNFGFCNHGYVLAGRGYGVRSAAQGTDYGNEYFMAAVFVGGIDGPPANEHAFDALEWIIAECRRLGADSEVRPHSYFHSTDCPGDHIRSKLSAYHNKTVPFPPTTPPKPVDEDTDMKATDQVELNSSAEDYLEARGAAVGTDHSLPYEWFVQWSHIEASKSAEALADILTVLQQINTKLDSLTPGTP